jgi:DNA repair photolyase
LVREIQIKSLLNKHKKRDEWFLGNYTINPYTGCSIGCIYCYTRGSKYGGDHGEKVAVKSNAVPILKKQLKNAIRRNERGFIILGSAADPYPSVEGEFKLSREILGLIKRYKYPVHILTKSTMVMRDLDILNDINDVAILPNELEGKIDSGVIISFSFSTMNRDVAQILEPYAPSPMERLETLKKCREEGFRTGMINMPVLPFISDSKEDIELMVKAAKNYHANYLLFAGLTLFGNAPEDCRTIYYNFLKEYHPELISKYEKIFKGSFAPSKFYQADLANKYREISDRFEVKNSII